MCIFPLTYISPSEHTTTYSLRERAEVRVIQAPTPSQARQMRGTEHSPKACTLIVDGGQSRPSDKDLEKLYAHSTELYHITRATITLTLSTPPPFSAACTKRSLICDGSPSFFIIRSISGSRTISHKPSEQSNIQSRACKFTVKQSTSTLRLSPRPRSTRLRSGCV